MNRLSTAVLLFVCITSVIAWSQQPKVENGVDAKGKYYPIEWNTTMVESTYRFSGPSSVPGKDTIGTGFVLGAPITDNGGDANGATVKVRPVLITAQHVLADIAGDTAFLDMRIYENGAWSEDYIPLKIRNKGMPLWVSLADVAILDTLSPRVRSHLITPLIPTDWLASDDFLQSYQIHPGDEVDCLGFPEGLSSQFGFPILRTARIASFPIIPTLSSRPLYLDFPVYGGNSGGPAYLPESSGRGSFVGPTLSHIFIIGLVIQKQYAAPGAQMAVDKTAGAEGETSLADMHLAILEPSSVIREAINLLPGVANGTIRTLPSK